MDELCWKILRALSHSPRTPQMLSRIYGIPIAMCWSRIRLLEEEGLVYPALTFFSGTGDVLTFYHLAPEGHEVLVEARGARLSGTA